MRLHPALASLTRHKIPVALLMLQVALTLAVISNSSFMLVDYMRRISVDSGVTEGRIGVVKLMPCSSCQAVDVNARALSYLHSIAGVSGVGVVNTVPFGPREADLGVRLHSEDKANAAGVHVFTFGPGAFDTLGLALVAGRAPNADDFSASDTSIPADGVTYISEALARKLWPSETPLGKTLYVQRSKLRVVGVLRALLRPEFELQPLYQAEWSLAVPVAPGAAMYGTYVIRTQPSELEKILASVRASFASQVPGLALDIQNTKSMPALRDTYLRGDKSIMGMLACIVLLTTVATTLGIVGLTSYWVRKRRRQIGVRRALGATRRGIALYFAVENGLIMCLGCTVGVAASYAINLELMRHYALERLPIIYLPLSFMLMIAIGQLAALGPAIRASRVQPVEAIRAI